MPNHGLPAKNATRASLAIEFLYAHPLKTAKGGAPTVGVVREKDKGGHPAAQGIQLQSLCISLPVAPVWFDEDSYTNGKIHAPCTICGFNELSRLAVRECGRAGVDLR